MYLNGGVSWRPPRSHPFCRPHLLGPLPHPASSLQFLFCVFLFILGFAFRIGDEQPRTEIQKQPSPRVWRQLRVRVSSCEPVPREKAVIGFRPGYPRAREVSGGEAGFVRRVGKEWPPRTPSLRRKINIWHCSVVSSQDLVSWKYIPGEYEEVTVMAVFS